MGIERITHLIDEADNLAQVFPKVKPETRAAEVLSALDAMS
jgi:peroxiredoxin